MDSVVVSVADDHLNDMSTVLTAMQQAGLVVNDIQEALGTVTGSIDADAIGRLETVPGVAAVERERRYQLPPPDADVQ